jgi:hypothetical protein
MAVDDNDGMRFHDASILLGLIIRESE